MTTLGSNGFCGSLRCHFVSNARGFVRSLLGSPSGFGGGPGETPCRNQGDHSVHRDSADAAYLRLQDLVAKLYEEGYLGRKEQIATPTRVKEVSSTFISTSFRNGANSTHHSGEPREFPMPLRLPHFLNESARRFAHLAGPIVGRWSDTVDSLPERLPDEISLYRACIDHQESSAEGAEHLKPFTVKLNHNTIL
jgi:hypothetical protein